MLLKIQIKTPPGQANKTQKKLRGFILKGTIPINSTVNDTDDTMVWEIDAPIKKCLKIQKRVVMFDSLMDGMLTNKMVGKAIKKHLSQEDQEQLKEMLTQQTSVSILNI